MRRFPESKSLVNILGKGSNQPNSLLRSMFNVILAHPKYVEEDRHAMLSKRQSPASTVISRDISGILKHVKVRRNQIVLMITCHPQKKRQNLNQAQRVRMKDAQDGPPSVSRGFAECDVK